SARVQLRGEIALDLLAVPGPAFELAHQPRGARAEAARHFPPVVLGYLPHRPIELELFDRSEDEHLLALERDPRTVADHWRAIVVARHQRPQRPQRRESDEHACGHEHAEKNDRRDALAARDEDDSRRAPEPGE